MRIQFACALLGFLTVAPPAAADVTLRQKTSGKMAMGGSGAGESTLQIKGMRMRTDDSMTGKPSSTIIDLTNQQMIVLNAQRREADVYEMAKLGETLAKIPVSDVQATITPTNVTRQLAGSTCTVHNMEVKVPTDMGGEKLTVVISGPACLAKSAAGQADFAAFYKAAADKGAFFGDPRGAKAMPAHAKALGTLHKELSRLGVPLAQEMNIRFEGTGPMAGMMGKVGGSTLITEVVSISADPIPDSTFEIPAGYKINKR